MEVTKPEGTVRLGVFLESFRDARRVHVFNREMVTSVFKGLSSTANRSGRFHPADGAEKSRFLYKTNASSGVTFFTSSSLISSSLS